MRMFHILLLCLDELKLITKIPQTKIWLSVFNPNPVFVPHPRGLRIY